MLPTITRRCVTIPSEDISSYRSHTDSVHSRATAAAVLVEEDLWVLAEEADMADLVAEEVATVVARWVAVLDSNPPVFVIPLSVAVLSFSPESDCQRKKKQQKNESTDSSGDITVSNKESNILT